MAETLEKIENKVIDQLAKDSNGHLIVFKPQGRLDVADLVVKKRAEYEDVKEIYIKIKPCQKDEGGTSYETLVPQTEFVDEPNYYLLFVHFDIVTQDFGKYIWLVPANKFIGMGEVVSQRGKSKTFHFIAPVDPKADSHYSKYLVENKELAKVLIMIIEKGGGFFFPSVGFSGIENTKPEEIKNFIIEARSNTFAGNSPTIDNPRLRGSGEFEYQRGDWSYHDVYFTGTDKIVGQEIVYHNQKPIWIMQYFGDQLDQKTVFFLKQALLAGVDKCRFGEGYQLKKKELSYQDVGEGTLDRFKGQEEMQISGKTIYKLNYQGGSIIKNEIRS